MSRTKKFFLNSISTAFYQVVLMIAGFITPRIMLKYYGSEINGLVTSINQFISYFNLVEAGLSGAAIYALYKPLAEKDHKAINGVVSAAKKFYTQSGYIFLFLTSLLAIFYPIYIKTNVLAPFEMGLLVLLLGTNGALEFFTLSKYRVLLTSDQKTYVISLVSTIYIIVNTIIVIIFGTQQVNIVILRFVVLLSIFLRSFILMIYVKINYNYIYYKAKPNTKALNKRWDALYLQILGVVHTGAPVVILTIVTRDLKLVSIYSIFNIVMAGINGILEIFKSGLSASFGDVIARGENKVLKKSYTEFEMAYYSLITIVYSISFTMIMPFIRVYTQDIADVDYNIPLFGFLIVLNGLLYNIKTPQGMLVISAGLYKETRIPTTIQGLMTVVLGFILAPFWGLYGVIAASIISNLYRDIDLIFFVPKHITKLPVANTVKRTLLLAISILLICLPIGNIDINPSGYIQWITYAIFIGLYACIVVFVISLLFDRKILKSVVYRIIGMVRR